MRRTAFTLIELLVVIAIISILAAILFPVFAKAKEAAKKTADLNQMKQLGTATKIYLSDYDDTHMAIPYVGGNTGAAGIHWADRLQPYVKNKQIFADGSNQKALFQDGGYWRPGANSPTDTDPARIYRVTYTYNHLISQSDDDPLATSVASDTSIEFQAETVLMGPSQNWYSYSSCRLQGSRVDMLWSVSNGNPEIGYEWWGFPDRGYSGGANFVYADSHAKFSKFSRTPDPQFGNGANNLYAGIFVGAFTRPSVGSNGVCPPLYDSRNIGF
ncbi:MAG: prepilin-type N-terminal cleavage/methylation domain-containing protein [Fimbriimonadaceae bacterium]|nr:prepilin-type N-terminal cleavage/methylation domain-containing protein [Fimbriimonadaceae bacterium]